MKSISAHLLPNNICKRLFRAGLPVFVFLLIFAVAPAVAKVIDVHSGETVTGDLLGTAEADQITVEEGGWVMGFVSGEGGDDYIVNNGNISSYLVGFELGEGGSPTLINNGTVWEEMVGTDSGTYDGDVVLVVNNGEVMLELYGGFNSKGTFTVINTGTVDGSIWGTAGYEYFPSTGDHFKASIYNSGTVSGDIYGTYIDGGNFYIENTGTVYGSIWGSILGNGYSEIHNSGTVYQDIVGTFGSHGRVYIENTGTVYGDIWSTALGDGDSVIINRGTVLGGIGGGYGDDVIMLVGGSSVGYIVDGFEGNDTLVLNNMGIQDGSLWGVPDGPGVYYDFENLSFTGADNRLTGTWQLDGVPVTVYDGYLTLNSGASLYASSLDVQSGGTASLLGTVSLSGALTVAGSLDSSGLLSAGSLLVSSGGSAVFGGMASIGGLADIRGNLNTGKTFLAERLSVAGSGVAELYGTNTVSAKVNNAGSLLVGGNLSAGRVESSGMLRVNGVLTSPDVFITSSGELYGSGRIKGDVSNSGTISPGNSAGLLTIEGNYTHNGTAVFLTEAEADGGTDLLYVTNRAFINGGTLNVSLERALYADRTSWTVLRADGGVSGNFAQLAGLEDSAVLSFDTVSTANAVMVELRRKDYAEFAANPNDTRVARALDRLLFSATGELDEMLSAVDWDMSAAEIRRALDELSPEMYASFEPASFELGRVFDLAMGLRMEQLDLGGAASRDSAGTYLLASNQAGLSLPAGGENEKGWAFWGRGLGMWSNRNSTEDYLGWDQKISGAVLGVDAAVSPRFTLGASLAATKSDMNWSKEGLGGDMNGLHAGLYGRAKFGPGRLRGSLSYARLDTDAEREIDYPGYSATAKGSFASDLLGARLEYGYVMKPGGWHLEPMAALGYQYLQRDSFEESGAGNLGLLVDGNSADQFTSRLGARLARDFGAWGWLFSPRMGLFWLHCFDGGRPDLKAAFPDRPDLFLTVYGLDQPEDSMQLQAGLDAAFNRRFSLFADYGFNYSEQGADQSFSAGLKFSF